MRRRNNRNSIPSRYILLGLCGVCIAAMILTYSFSGSGGPVNSVVSYLFLPMQKGINAVGTFFNNQSNNFLSNEQLMKENEELQNKVDALTEELNITKIEQYELEDLRKLYELDQKYPEYKKVAANVIGKDAGNWFHVFLIDKGTKDGVDVDMNVMAGNGLVGIVIEAGPHYAKVRSIIDDSSKVSGMVLSTSANCIVAGDLKTMNENNQILFSNLKDKKNKVKKGDQVVTSYVSDKYLQGLLIGYINDNEMDSNNITKSGTITPAADFENLRKVLIITEKKADALSDAE